MRAISIKVKLLLGAMSAVFLGVGATVAAFASIPSVQGVINGCRSDLSGQLSVVDSNASCDTGQTSLTWDRGVVAYGHLTYAGNQLELVSGQSLNMSQVTPSFQDPAALGCLDLPASIENNVRFVSLAGSAAADAEQVYVKNMSQEETDMVASYCGGTADILIMGSGSVYLSVY